MSDLRDEIRERLEMHPTAMPGADLAAANRVNAWVASAVEGFMAILEVHVPDGGTYPNCVECSCSGALAATDCHYSMNWPCWAVRAIAAVVGIESMP